MAKGKTWAIAFIAAGCFGWAVTACQREESRSGVAAYEEDGNYRGNIFVSLAHPNNGADAKKEDYFLVIAAPANTDAVAYCAVDVPEDCRRAKYGTNRISNSSGDKRFFVSKRSVPLQSALRITFVAWNTEGKEIEHRSICFEYQENNGACFGTGSSTGSNNNSGSNNNTNNSNNSTGNGNTNNNSGNNSGNNAGAADQIVAANCATGGCHSNGGYRTASSLRGTDAASRIQSGNMPKGRTLNASDRQALLDALR